MLDRSSAPSTEAMDMGHTLEPANADIYAGKTGRRVERCQELLASTRYPWLGATLDCFTWLPGEDAPGPLELKITGKKLHWPEDDAPAEHYQAQLQAQMLVVGAGWGSLSAIIGEPYLHHRWLDFLADPSLADAIVNETGAFMESARRGIEPPVDGSEDTAQALRRLTRTILPDSVRELPDAALDWDRELRAAQSALAAWAARETYYKNLLATAIGDAEHGDLPGGAGRYSFKVQHRKGYAVAPSAARVLRRIHTQTTHNEGTDTP
jgi:hypothetical protein